MEKHFVKFFSPGTIVAEDTVKPIDSWSQSLAVEMSRYITERHGATPYGFKFLTRTRAVDALDSHVSATSGMYYLQGKVETLTEIKAKGDPANKILIGNMECNGWDKVVTSTKGYKWTQPFNENDVLIEEKIQ